MNMHMYEVNSSKKLTKYLICNTDGNLTLKKKRSEFFSETGDLVMRVFELEEKGYKKVSILSSTLDKSAVDNLLDKNSNLDNMPKKFLFKYNSIRNI